MTVWQYNGAAPMTEIIEWCERFLPDQYIYPGLEMIIFRNNGAYAWFLLRWQ